MNAKQIFVTLVAIVMAALLAACNTASAGTETAPVTPIQEITIKAADYSFAAPDQIKAGLVKVNLVNDGQEPHHAQLVRLNQGVTMDQFQAALQEGEAAAFPLITFAGGPGLVDPGLASQVTLDLTPGQYVLLCFMPSPDGVPHLAKGMVRPIEVVADAGSAQAAQPKADATVKLLDFSFVLPSEIKAGPQAWQVVNEGKQVHEIMIVKLADGKTMSDVHTFLQSFAGAPPFADVGGFQAINPGQTGWLHLNLEPGNYAALCHVPDPESGQAHELLGMALPFTIE